MIASITRSQSARSPYSSVPAIRPRTASASSCSTLALLDRAGELLVDLGHAAVERVLVGLADDDVPAGLGADLRDPVAHQATADDSYLAISIFVCLSFSCRVFGRARLPGERRAPSGQADPEADLERAAEARPALGAAVAAEAERRIEGEVARALGEGPDDDLVVGRRQRRRAPSRRARCRCRRASGRDGRRGRRSRPPEAVRPGRCWGRTAPGRGPPRRRRRRRSRCHRCRWRRSPQGGPRVARDARRGSGRRARARCRESRCARRRSRSRPVRSASPGRAGRISKVAGWDAVKPEARRPPPRAGAPSRSASAFMPLIGRTITISSRDPAVGVEAQDVDARPPRGRRRAPRTSSTAASPVSTCST